MSGATRPATLALQLRQRLRRTAGESRLIVARGRAARLHAGRPDLVPTSSRHDAALARRCGHGHGRHRRRRRGPRRGRRRHLYGRRGNDSSSATPATTTSSAAGATTGSPAAPATTASSATTAASSPAATASTRAALRRHAGRSVAVDRSSRPRAASRPRSINARSAARTKTVDLTPFNRRTRRPGARSRQDPSFARCTPTTSSSAASATTSCTAARATTRSPAPRRCRSRYGQPLGRRPPRDRRRRERLRPLQPGNVLRSTSTAAYRHRGRGGEFALYDEYDPRRADPAQRRRHRSTRTAATSAGDVLPELRRGPRVR